MLYLFLTVWAIALLYIGFIVGALSQKVNNLQEPEYIEAEDEQCTLADIASDEVFKKLMSDHPIIKNLLGSSLVTQVRIDDYEIYLLIHNSSEHQELMQQVLSEPIAEIGLVYKIEMVED